MATRFGVGLAAATALVIAAAGVATVTRDDAQPLASTTTTSSKAIVVTTTTARPPSATTTVPPVAWAAVPSGPAKAVVTSKGVVLAVLAVHADGTFLARSPCGGEVTVAGTALTGANVVLDPGHGGDEPGAVGPAGTTEKAVNLAIARETERQLEELGA